MILNYVALIEQSKKTGEYGVAFPDFPGYVSSGDTLDESICNAKKGLIFHIEGMNEDNEILPKPTPFDKVHKSMKNKSIIICIISLTVELII